MSEPSVPEIAEFALLIEGRAVIRGGILVSPSCCCQGPADIGSSPSFIGEAIVQPWKSCCFKLSSSRCNAAFLHIKLSSRFWRLVRRLAYVFLFRLAGGTLRHSWPKRIHREHDASSALCPRSHRIYDEVSSNVFL